MTSLNDWDWEPFQMGMTITLGKQVMMNIALFGSGYDNYNNDVEIIFWVGVRLLVQNWEPFLLCWSMLGLWMTAIHSRNIFMSQKFIQLLASLFKSEKMRCMCSRYNITLWLAFYIYAHVDVTYTRVSRSYASYIYNYIYNIYMYSINHGWAVYSAYMRPETEVRGSLRLIWPELKARAISTANFRWPRSRVA